MFTWFADGSRWTMEFKNKAKQSQVDAGYRAVGKGGNRDDTNLDMRYICQMKTELKN